MLRLFTTLYSKTFLNDIYWVRLSCCNITDHQIHLCFLYIHNSFSFFLSSKLPIPQNLVKSLLIICKSYIHFWVIFSILLNSAFWSAKQWTFSFDYHNIKIRIMCNDKTNIYRNHYKSQIEFIVSVFTELTMKNINKSLGYD